MRDFRKLVAPHRKQDPYEQEIVSELACHLEEMVSGPLSRWRFRRECAGGRLDRGQEPRRYRPPTSLATRRWLENLAAGSRAAWTCPGSRLRSGQHGAGYLLGIFIPQA